MPGAGSLPWAWNMLRISAVASTGAGSVAAGRTVTAGVLLAVAVSRTK
jgi:hypothetical protein